MSVASVERIATAGMASMVAVKMVRAIERFPPKKRKKKKKKKKRRR